MGRNNNGVSPDNQTPGLLSGYEGFLEGYQQGQIQKLRGDAQNAHANGYDRGYEEGERAGYDKGWDDGINRGNRELMKADGYIKGYLADKERLQQTVNAQAQQIEQLLAHIANLEKAGLQHDGSTHAIHQTSLPQMVRELREENEAKSNECAERAWQSNRTTTVLKAMRNTLMTLTSDKESSRTAEIEHLFCEHYKKELSIGLEKGYLLVPLEEDAVFASTMPSTHQFLTSVLQSENERIELKRANKQYDDDGDWVPSGS